MLALFRMIPITKGNIIIDGVDIMDIRKAPLLSHPSIHFSDCSFLFSAVSEMRRKISVVPSDPILFNTSIRENLDSFEIHKDNEIWAALDKVFLLFHGDCSFIIAKLVFSFNPLAYRSPHRFPCASSSAVSQTVSTLK